jgi:hypothetical protein
VHAPSDDSKDSFYEELQQVFAHAMQMVFQRLTVAIRPAPGCPFTFSTVKENEFHKNNWPYIKNTFNKPHLIVMLQHTIPRTYPIDSSNINAISELRVMNFGMWYNFQIIGPYYNKFHIRPPPRPHTCN